MTLAQLAERYPTSGLAIVPNVARTTTGFVLEPASAVGVVEDGFRATDLTRSEHPGLGLMGRPASSHHPRHEGGVIFGPNDSDGAEFARWPSPCFKDSSLRSLTWIPIQTGKSRRLIGCARQPSASRDSC